MRLHSVLLSLALALPAAAWQKEVNTGDPGPHLKIRPVSLTYEMSWNGALNSGRINLIFGRADKRFPNSFIAQGFGQSSGVASKVFPFKFEYTSFLRRDDYTPTMFVAKERDNKETKDTTNRFGKTTTSVEVTTPHGKGAAASTDRETFTYDDHTVYDLLSSILHIRSLPLTNGDEVVMLMHPFNSPYLARIKVVGREVHNGRKSIKLDLKLNKIDDRTMKLKTYKKMKTTTMWVSDDVERLPIELRVDAFIGDVRAVLDGYRYLE